MKYADYTAVEQFALDDAFKEWVLTPDADRDAFWEAWVRQHPEKRRLVEEARQMLLALRFEERFPSRESFGRVWGRINQSRRKLQAEERQREAKAIPMWSGKVFLRVAAALAFLMLLGGVLLFRNSPGPVREYVTQYGETRKVVLPDSSTVVLNANSRLRVPSGWVGASPGRCGSTEKPFSQWYTPPTTRSLSSLRPINLAWKCSGRSLT